MFSMRTPIKEIREKLKMTQQEFGDAIGIGQSAVSQYERGQREPKIEIAKKMISLAVQKKISLTLDQIYNLEPL